MPRENRERMRGFIYLPREKSIVSDITVDGTSVLLDYLTASFTRAVAPEIGDFKINLINASGKFSNLYSGGETVKLFIDFTDGTTQRFEGTIDNIKNKRIGFETLEISGGHISSELLDLTVTKEYNGIKSCDTILKEIITDKLTGFTSNNIATSTVTPNIKWSNVPFWTAVDQLCQLAVADNERTTDLNRFDCYVDDDKDFHFFKENSIENNDEAIANNTLIKLDGFGDKIFITKNSAIVYGEIGGLPIIRTDNDLSAQTSFKLKEEVITNTDIILGTQAEEIASSIISNQAQPKKEGKALYLILPSLEPGQKIWISEPTMKINQQIKINKFTHFYPKEQTEVIMTREQNLPRALRELSLGDLANADIINPYEMTQSINLTFDDFNDLSLWDSNVEIVDGKIKLSSGSTGDFTSNTFTQDSDITQIQLLANAEQNSATTYKISTDGGTTLRTINLGLNTVTAGKDIVLKVFITSASAEIDSLALLIK